MTLPRWDEVVRRIPFTLGVVATMLVVGLVTGSLWLAVEDRPLWDVVAYGLPAFQDGRWWTPVTGAFFAVAPWQYLPVAGGFLLLVGWSEWTIGTRRAAVAACTTQLAGVLGAAAVLAVTSDSGWEWAARVADDLDVGFSAGALGAVAAASVAVSPPWRARLRTVLVMYVVIAFLYIGLLWDLEHLIGVGIGLLLGPLLVGRAPHLVRPRLSRHEWRLTAAALFALNAVIRLVLWFVPADGPLGATSEDTEIWSVLVGAGISLLLANGLRTGSRRAWRWAVAITGLVVGLLVLVGLAALLDPGEVTLDLGDAGAAAPALVVDIGLWLLQLTVLLLGRRAFTRPSRRRLRSGEALVGADDQGQAVQLLKANGGDTLSWMGTWPANSWFVPPDASGRPAGYVAFQLHSGVAVALGDPVAGDAAARAEVLGRFVDEQDRLGQQFCLFSVTDEVVSWAEARGYRSVHVAEEAIIDLPDLEFRGKSWQDVRTALNRAGKEGVTYRSGRLAEMPRGVQVQVRAISELWVSDKGLPEMGFTLGGVDEALDPEVTVGLAVDGDGTVHGVTSWLPVFAPGGGHEGWTLDVMRRLPDGFRPVTEFLIASACLDFQAQGAQYVSLSGAPLAHAGGEDASLGGLERLLDALGAAMEPLYGFRSLDSFNGEGAQFIDIDYGQFGGAGGPGPGQQVPVNPLGDPPGGRGVALSPPYSQGGALRSQSVRRPGGQPVVLSGVMLRIDPNTGAGLPDNPLAGSPDLNARRIVAYGLRNPFRMAARPGTSEVYVGDVGWNTIEEINRVDVAAGFAANFGWPCYEGYGLQTAYAPAGFASCLSLYAEGSAAQPYYAYNHANQIVSGETCSTGSSSVTGLAFYTAGSYPAAYQGALFFTDWSRHCIWAMLPGANGRPDPAQIVTFDSGLPGGPVHLERGPAGDIFYVDLDGGRVQRISYFAANQPPVAAVVATPTSGTSPMLVQFDASSSFDPDGDPLAYFWDLDGDGTFTDSTAVNPTFTYTTAGKHTATVFVTDFHGYSWAQVNVYVDDQPPHAVITTPSSSLMWKVGDQIFFAGTGTDAEDGALPPSAFRWTLLMHHCPSNCHVHTIQSWTGIAGGSFSAPNHEYPSWIELTLTVTDSTGLSHTTSVDLQPRTVSLTLNSVPSGLTVVQGTASGPTPLSQTVIVGSNVTVSAQTPQSLGGQTYAFSSWSDGGGPTHQVTAPATPLTLTVNFGVAVSLSLSQTVTPAILTGGRATITATMTNTGDATATGVSLTEALPPGVTLLSSTPPAACTPSGAGAVCTVPNLAQGASAVVTLVLRVRPLGTVPFTGTVAAAQADANPLDNSATASVVVRPVGDFDGDGREDLLWRNSSTGQVTAWYMNNAAIAGSATLSPSRGSDLNWRVGGVGDFDGDGKPDLVWRNQATGADEVWLMNGMTRTAVVPLFSVPDTGWQIVSVGDFNNDGWPDLLWQYQSGISMVVYMTGTTVSGSATAATIPSPWTVPGAADLNNDGNVDEVWRRPTDGVTVALMMSGLTVTNALQMFSTPDVNWRPVSFADLNGDGKPDLVIRNQTTGLVVALYQDGVTIIGGAVLPAVSDLTWAVVGPR